MLRATSHRRNRYLEKSPPEATRAQACCSHFALDIPGLDFTLRPRIEEGSLRLVGQGVPVESQQLQRQVHLDRDADNFCPDVRHLRRRHHITGACSSQTAALRCAIDGNGQSPSPPLILHGRCFAVGFETQGIASRLRRER